MLLMYKPERFTVSTILEKCRGGVYGEDYFCKYIK